MKLYLLTLAIALCGCAAPRQGNINDGILLLDVVRVLK